MTASRNRLITAGTACILCALLRSPYGFLLSKGFRNTLAHYSLGITIIWLILSTLEISTLLCLIPGKRKITTIFGWGYLVGVCYLIFATSISVLQATYGVAASITYLISAIFGLLLWISSTPFFLSEALGLGIAVSGFLLAAAQLLAMIMNSQMGAFLGSAPELAMLVFKYSAMIVSCASIIAYILSIAVQVLMAIIFFRMAGLSAELPSGEPCIYTEQK
jgi:hypothetical protein